MPTITQLEYIIAVDTYRHFGIAAQKSFVTQPTLSMQIKKAEEALGVVIFDRSKQPVIPTDIGELLIAQARTVLREAQKMDELVADYQNEVSGRLRIGIIPTLAPYLLPVFVGNFIRKYPKISLQIKEMQTDAIAEALKNDLLDLGLLVTPLQDPVIHELPLFYEEIKLYLHPEHIFLEQYPERVPSAALQETDMWLLSAGHCFRNQMINLCELRQELSTSSLLPFEYESGSLDALQRLVDKEGGYTLLPELAVSENAQGLIKSLSLPIPLREVSLVYVRNFAKIKLLELLKEEIISAMPPAMFDKNRGQLVEWR